MSKKRTVFTSLALLAIGVPPLVNSLDNPRLAGLRGLDILRLILIGFCLGGALVVFLVGVFHGRRSDNGVNRGDTEVRGKIRR